MRLLELYRIILGEKDKYDTRTTGTYAGYHFDKNDVKKIRKWSINNKIPNRTPSEKIHTTLLYSKKPCPDYEPLGELNPPIIAKPSKLEIWPTQDEKHALVLRFDAPDMIDRHNTLMDELDATYDFNEYKPHITISYDVGPDFDMSKLNDIKKYIGNIKAVEEYSEELVQGWKNKDKK